MDVLLFQHLQRLRAAVGLKDLIAVRGQIDPQGGNDVLFVVASQNFVHSRFSLVMNEIRRDLLGCDAVLDGLPLHLGENRGDRDRNIGKHEHREGKSVEDLLPRRRMDLFPLRCRRDRADEKQRQVYGAEHLQQGKQRRCVCSLNKLHGDQRQIARGAEYGKQKCRQDVHGHIIAREAAFEHPPAEF